MKHAEACLSAIEDRENSFHHCESTVRLLQACLYAGKTWQSRFNLRGSAVKHVEACLSAIEDRENSFHHCGSTVRLLQDCSCAGKS